MRRCERSLLQAVAAQHPWQRRARRAFQPAHHALAVLLIQASKELIEQQQARRTRQGTGKQHQTAFTMGQGQEAAPCERLRIKAAQQRERAPALQGR